MIYTIPTEAFAYTDAYKKFAPIIQNMIKSSRYAQDIEENALQPYNEKNQKSVMSIVEEILHPQSAIINLEHLEKLSRLLEAGKSCLLLPEHFSNFDYPGLFYLSQQHSSIAPMFQKLICMAASKLNTESKVVLAFSEAFNRIMIYPAREKEKAQEEQAKEEQQKLELLTQRGLKKMLECKNKGHAILMFPAGTRYRPNKPESRHALQQVASFIKQFDYFCLIGIAGNTLVVNPNNAMAQDIVRKDTIVYFVDEVQNSKEFLKTLQEESPDLPAAEFKNHVAQNITQSLMELHEKAEAIRAPLVEAAPPHYLGPFVPEHPPK